GDVMHSQTGLSLDRQVALARVGDDMDLLKEIAELFLSDYPTTLTEIHDAVGRSDWSTVERSAHGLKGAVANFGAEGATTAALHLERLGRFKEATQIPQAVEELERELASLATDLAAL